MKAQPPRRLGREMPPRKPLDKHKQSMTVSIDPENRQWLRDHYADYGFRNESHAVDEAIRRLRTAKEQGADQ